MRKQFCCLLSIILVLCLFGCTPGAEEDGFKVEVYVDEHEVYGVQIDIYQAGSLVSSHGGCNADGSALSTKYPLDFFLPEDSEAMTLQFQVVDSQGQEYPCDGSISIDTIVGEYSQVLISGSFSEGFSVLPK